MTIMPASNYGVRGQRSFLHVGDERSFFYSALCMLGSMNNANRKCVYISLTLQQACCLLQGCQATQGGAVSWSRAARGESRRRSHRRRQSHVGMLPPFSGGEEPPPADQRPPPPAAPPGLQDKSVGSLTRPTMSTAACRSAD